jgi:tyrosyl-tRNA synthetase
VDVDAQLRLLTANAVNVISEGDLQAKLELGTPLRIKLGIDPTASDIHLGFAVVLRRLRMFQDCGHVAVLILGDFTAMVGDPSGKSATRPRLSKEDVDAHAETYVAQIADILDTSPGKLEVRRNSEWLAGLDMEDVLRLTSQVTVARMLERDDFAKRYAGGVAISLMEFLYPLLQGLDSVEIRADVELGGTDQLFNLIMGRHLQERAGQAAQVVLTTPLLVGLDGEQKMSKSLGNFIGIKEPPAEQFGKVMSIPDDAMPMYARYATGWDPDRIDELVGALEAGSLHPNEAKRAIGRAVADLYHGTGAGAAAEAEFDRVFKARAQPSEMPSFAFAPGVTWAALLTGSDLAKSKREARRLIDEGGVKANGQAVRDDGSVPTGEHVVQVGRRRWARVTVSAS